MSKLDLHEFNTISKRHKFFLTNNRNEFPFIKENSLFLKKILKSKTSYSNKSIIDINGNKLKSAKSFVNNDAGMKNYNPIIVIENPNDLTKNFIRKRYHRKRENNQENLTNFYLSQKNSISPYNKNQRKISKKDSIEENHYKIPMNFVNSPNFYIPQSKTFRTYNNMNSENDRVILNYKGRKIFNDSFSVFNTPDKNLNRSKRELSELYRNTEEMERKKDEIYDRKIKRESSTIRKEMLKREKSKELKRQKLNIDFKSVNSSINSERSKSKNKKIDLNRTEIKNNKTQIYNRFTPNGDNLIIYNTNSSNFIKNNQNSINNNSIKPIMDRRKRIIAYRINRNNINYSRLSKINNSKDQKLSPTIKSNETFSKNNFKNNNIYLSKENEKEITRTKTNINYKIKENLEFFRLSKNKKRSHVQDNSNKSKSKSSNENNNRYNLITRNKRYTEDYTFEEPTIYSSDKKLSIKVHLLPNLNELFLGKKMTKQKLKMQRVLSLWLYNEDVDTLNFLRNIYFSNKINEHLPSIKEEQQIIKNEFKSKQIKTESKNEAKEKPIYRKNIRMKYLTLMQNKKQNI